MNKVFLYLYPIEEYSNVFNLGDEYYDKNNIRRPFEVLNETIQRRYRDNGFKVVFALYPDKKIFGILPKQEDRMIYTDVSFTKASSYNPDGSRKAYNEITYPNEQELLSQLGNVDELVIGGYHANDCVKRVGEVAISNGINTLIDLDMTDLFFNLYKQDDYFDLESYDHNRFKRYMLKQMNKYGDDLAERMFNRNYYSSVYGFDKLNNKQK